MRSVLAITVDAAQCLAVARRALLKQVLPLIDLGNCNEASLRMLGIDDALDPVVPVMLGPQTLAMAFARGQVTSSSALRTWSTEYIIGPSTRRSRSAIWTGSVGSVLCRWRFREHPTAQRVRGCGAHA